jgi:DNA-binding response OmpR family regulator
LWIGTILVVESDPYAERNLGETLRRAGFRVRFGSARAPGVDVALITMQVGALSSSGPASRIQHIYSRIRREGPNLPVIVLGPHDIDLKVRLFELGVDDYLVVPFDPLELLARIGSLIRRQKLSRF